MVRIIANARIKGGLSGGDNIYLHLAEHCEHKIWEMMDTGFKPFLLCYVWKIIKACWIALWDKMNYEFVYSASDFWMDSLPAFILKLKGQKWVAGFYMFAPEDKVIYWWTQRPIIWLIEHFADVVCVTNESMFLFKKPMVAMQGGVDLTLAYPDDKEKIYDAVFVGRLHYTKGIDELIEIWSRVRRANPKMTLAIIGDGDTEVEKVKHWTENIRGITWLRYQGDSRFDIYRQSRMVLYPTPHGYAHFSMGPVEAMACGCTLIAFDLDVIKNSGIKGAELCKNSYYFSRAILRGVNKSKEAVEWARTWDWSVRMPKVLKEIRGNL